MLRNRKLALGNMPVAYFNQRGFFRRKSDSARRCSVGAASNPSSSQKIALARKTKYAAVAHLVERHLAKVEVASSSLVSRSKSKDTDVIRCFFFYPQHTHFLYLHKIRGRGPRESLRLLRGVDASSSLVSRSKSKDTDVIRCFFYPQHTHFLHFHKIRGRGVDASLSLVSRSKSKKHRCIRCFLFYPNRQPLLILCRFTASP